MKRAGIIILFILCAVGAMQAQEVRSGGYGVSKSVQDCDKMYQQYRKNRNIEIAGWSLFGSGAFISAVMGSALLGAHVATNEGSYLTAAISLYGAGAVVGITGIPLIIAGNVQKKKVRKEYNTLCGSNEQETSQLELKLTSGANGLGLALAF